MLHKNHQYNKYVSEEYVKYYSDTILKSNITSTNSTSRKKQHDNTTRSIRTRLIYGWLIFMNKHKPPTYNCLETWQIPKYEFRVKQCQLRSVYKNLADVRLAERLTPFPSLVQRWPISSQRTLNCGPQYSPSGRKDPLSVGLPMYKGRHMPKMKEIRRTVWPQSAYFPKTGAQWAL